MLLLCLTRDDWWLLVAGMTLDYVKVNLDGIFAEGQVYVALSRARSMESLQVIGTYNPRDVRYALPFLTTRCQ